jgi:hypothetical protein
MNIGDELIMGKSIWDQVVSDAESVADTATLDYFDFDKKGGSLPLSGAGESTGAQAHGNPTKPTVTNKPLTGKTGSGTSSGQFFVNGPIPVGIPFEVKTPSGKVRTYHITKYEEVKKSNKQSTDAVQNREISKLKTKVKQLGRRQ